MENYGWWFIPLCPLVSVHADTGVGSSLSYFCNFHLFSSPPERPCKDLADLVLFWSSQKFSRVVTCSILCAFLWIRKKSYYFTSNAGDIWIWYEVNKLHLDHLPRHTVLTFLLLWSDGALRGTWDSCNFFANCSIKVQVHWIFRPPRF